MIIKVIIKATHCFGQPVPSQCFTHSESIHHRGKGYGLICAGSLPLLSPDQQDTCDDQESTYDIASIDCFRKNKNCPDQAPDIIDSTVCISHIYRESLQILLPENGIDCTVCKDEKSPQQTPRAEQSPGTDGIRGKLGKNPGEGKNHDIQMKQKVCFRSGLSGIIAAHLL
jgi:hypothetical protein